MNPTFARLISSANSCARITSIFAGCLTLARGCGFVRYSTLGLIVACASVAGVIAPARGESSDAATDRFDPKLLRFTLSVAPTTQHLASMPHLPAEWRLTPPIAAHFDAVLKAGEFNPALATALRKSFHLEPATGEGVIAPDAALLNLFHPAERLRWWAVLGAHGNNRPYRWPIAVPRARLDAMASRADFATAIEHVRAWSVADGKFFLFADIFSLEADFSDAATRDDFFRQIFAVDTTFAKVATTDQSDARSLKESRYWQGEGQSRAVESILESTRRIDGYERLDITHLLPRLPRSLLHTFPPDLGVHEEPSVENAIAAVSFFRTTFDARTELDAGFATWLGTHCEPVHGERELGDIVVFENPAQKRWPFAMVYVADGLLFGRRPGLYGPWELLPETGIAQLNPRLRGQSVTTFRVRRLPPAGPSAATVAGIHDAPFPEPAKLTPLADGPWGRLSAYDVLLSPSSEILEELPTPSAEPEWTFAGVTPDEAISAIHDIAMPANVRGELEKLFHAAQPDRRGRFTVHPATALVFSTPPAFREALFPYLIHGVDGSAYAQDIPIGTRSSPAEWFPPGSMPESMRKVVLALTYRRGGGLALSDFGALWHAAPTAEDRLATLRTLYQSPVLIMLLKRPTPEEVPGLVNYWRIHQQKSVGALIDSFARDGAMNYLDVIHLLPPLARETMNVFMWAPVDAPTPSCYWTALNFSAERPDPRLLITPRAPGSERKIVEQKLREGYVPVDKASELGDVIVYRRRRDKEPLHVCTFIAADVVFTKNGFGFSSPWCLMHLDDVDALYLESGVVDRLVFRAVDKAAR